MINYYNRGIIMKYVIWGAGYRGRFLSQILGEQRIAAFIDSDSEKIGSSCCGKPIISYEIYKEKYQHCVVIIAITYQDRVAQFLEKDGVFYFGIEDCPPEYMGYGWRVASKYFKSPKLDVPDDTAVYGLTLFGVLVYEWLMGKGCKNIALIPHDGVTQESIRKFSSYFPHICIKNLDDISKENLLAAYWDSSISAFKPKQHIQDIFDWTKYISEYRNERITKMRDRHKGERCFIVATGPSLRYSDLELLQEHGEFCISMNAIFRCFEHTTWRPDQYVIVDVDAIGMWADILPKLDVREKFIADSQVHFDYDTLGEDCFIYHSISGGDVHKNSYFSEDFSEKAYNWGTVTGTCIQLAVYEGFTEIYLLGVDFLYKAGQVNHFATTEETEDNFDDKRMEFIQGTLSKSYHGYQVAKSYTDSHNIKIYNATRGGELDVFERADFDALMHVAADN